MSMKHVNSSAHTCVNLQAFDLQFVPEGKPPAAGPYCAKQFQFHSLAIAPRTLPTGFYQVVVEADVEGVARVNVLRSIYVKVERSPLRAFIEGGPEHFVYTSENDTYYINLFRDSHDPDVELYNLTGIQYGLWCLTDQSRRVYINDNESGELM